MRQLSYNLLLLGGAKLKPIRGSRDEVPDLDELTNGSV